MGHRQAVQLNYPKEVLASDTRIVTAYTVNMANAVTPSAPQRQFAALDCPFGIWIGANDELLLPNKVLAFANLAASVRMHSHASSVPNAKHLSVLLKAHELVGSWIAGSMA